MDVVVRGPVRASVCAECLSTFFRPGDLERLAEALGPGNARTLRALLE
jgi:hypothetical protein